MPVRFCPGCGGRLPVFDAYSVWHNWVCPYCRYHNRKPITLLGSAEALVVWMVGLTAIYVIYVLVLTYIANDF